MAQERVGILIEAIDKVSAVLGTIGKAGGSSLRAIDDAAKLASQGMSGMGAAIRTVDHAMNIARRGFRMMEEAARATIGTALEYRTANDPVVKQLKEFADSVSVAKARIGDALLPALQGVAKTFTPIVKGITDWINANRALIATNIIQWLASVGNVAISIVANGILYISRAWTGWREIVAVTRIAVNEFFALVIEGTGAALKGLANMAAAIGADGIAASLAEAYNNAVMLWEEFDRGSSASATEIGMLIAEQQKLENKIIEIGKVAKEVYGQSMANAIKAAARASKGLDTKPPEEEKPKPKDKDGHELSDLMKKRQKEGQRLREQEEEEKQKAYDQDVQRAQSMASVWEQMGEQIASGQMSAGQAAKQALVSTARTAIMTACASAMAKAVEAYSGLPFVGVVLGLAAAGIVSGIILGYLGKFESGGAVAGLPGDRNIIAVGDKERVLSVRQNQAFERLVAAISAPMVARPSAAGAGGGSVTLNYRSLFAPTSAETRKHVRDVERVKLSMARRGL